MNFFQALFAMIVMIAAVDAKAAAKTKPAAKSDNTWVIVGGVLGGLAVIGLIACYAMQDKEENTEGSLLEDFQQI